MNEEVRTLIKYRLAQADESIEEARILRKENMSLRGVVNRLYYAMFYATLALLQAQSLGTSKHAGVVSLFDKEFVKRGIFDKTMSQALHRGFELRQKADYMEKPTISKEDVDELLNSAVSFVDRVKQHCQEKQLA